MNEQQEEKPGKTSVDKYERFVFEFFSNSNFFGKLQKLSLGRPTDHDPAPNPLPRISGHCWCSAFVQIEVFLIECWAAMLIV